MRGREPPAGSEPYALRAALVIALSVGYYLLVLAPAAFVIVVVGLTARNLRASWLWTVSLVLGVGWVARSLLRGSTLVPAGPELRPADHPRLFELLQSLATRAAIPVPLHVFVTTEANVSVADTGGLLRPGRRTLLIGFPVLETLTVRELTAVLAHEFGHYRGGDTRLGPLAHGMRRRIEESIEGFEKTGPALANALRLYGRLFLRLTGALSRARERSADLFAARVAGAACTAEALSSVHALDGLDADFWSEEVHPVLGAGFRPPVLDLFRRYVRSGPVRAKMAETLAGHLASTEAHPFDSHPPLPERLARLERLGAGAPSPAGRDDSAASGLVDVERLETELLEHLLGAERLASLARVPWADPDAAYVAIWRSDLRSVEAALGGITADRLPVRDGALLALAGSLAMHRRLELGEEQGRVLASRVLGEALAVLLHDRGWVVSKIPGEVVTASSGGVVIEPFRIPRSLASGELGGADWARLCEDIGISGVALTTVLAPAAHHRRGLA